MTKIAFLLLCHKDPDGVVAQAKLLTHRGDYVVVHYDARASKSDFQKIQSGLLNVPGVVFAKRRFKCGWGEWSLVAATLEILEVACDAFPDAAYFYLVSGDCQPIKPLSYLHKTVARSDRDYIETVDFFTSGWIRTGMRDDRLFYRHLFNERSQKALFYLSLEVQRKLGLTRRPPSDLRMMIGSQWWCLRRQTVVRLFAFLKERPDATKFFSTTWIPDETFFQTLVRHLVPDNELTGRAPTFLMFTDYGMPVTFYNDHYGLLLRQNAFFARKVSVEANDLKSRLTDLWEQEQSDVSLSDEGRRLHGFLTGQGRVGRRFAPRFWEEAKPSRKRELLLVICKKWHVAKRLLRRANSVTGLPTVDFVFHEQPDDMPCLGGLENSVAKRNRHRRAVVGMLFEAYQANKLALCLDLSAIDMVRDLCAGELKVRLLEIECEYSDAYLSGHAHRIGLVAEQSSDEVISKVLPTLRNEIDFDHERLAQAEFSGVSRISETANNEENASVLASFFGVSTEHAVEILENTNLFHD